MIGMRVWSVDHRMPPVRMHRVLRAAGIPAELHVLEAAPHGFFGGGRPEDQAKPTTGCGTYASSRKAISASLSSTSTAATASSR